MDSIVDFLAAARLALPDVLFGQAGAERLLFNPVSVLPGRIAISSVHHVTPPVLDKITEQLRGESHYTKTKTEIIGGFVDLDHTIGEAAQQMMWPFRQMFGYTLISPGSKWEFYTSLPDVHLAAWRDYLKLTGKQKTDIEGPVVAYLSQAGQATTEATISSALNFVGLGDGEVEVGAIDHLIERLSEFCKAPTWRTRHDTVYASKTEVLAALRHYLRKHVEEAVLENIDEAIAKGMPPKEALERAGQAMSPDVGFHQNGKFDPADCLANIYSSQSLVDVKKPLAPQISEIFSEVIELGAKQGFSIAKEQISKAQERISDLHALEQALAQKSKHIEGKEMTFDVAAAKLRDLITRKKVANDSDVSDNDLSPATSIHIALALGRELAETARREIITDFASSMPDVHVMLSAIRTSDLPEDWKQQMSDTETQRLIRRR